MDASWIPAIQSTVNDGVNSAFRPDQIGNAQMAWASNVSIRDGKMKTRDYKLVQRATLPKGMYQGGSYFSVQDGMFVISIWGQLWRITVNGTVVSVDQIALDSRNSSIIPQVWFCETAGSLVMQDGQSAPIIFDGASARRSNIFGGEVPLGTAMSYGNGRLAVVVGGNTIQVGNITSSLFQSELQFTENTYLSGGGAFYFSQPISGLAFLPVNNTATGFGSLIVLGQRYTDSLHLEITSRETWSQIPGFQQLVLPGIGAAGQYTIVKVNQDLYWRDQRGNIWSLRSAQWGALSPGNSPVSREVARIVDFETKALLQYSSGIFFNNRLYYLASPFYNQYGAASFLDMISLDAAALATMRGKAPPAYDGTCEGLRYVGLLQGQIVDDDRAFVVSTDLDGENRLWEIVPNEISDYSYITDPATLSVGSTVAYITPSPVTAYAESRRFLFGDEGKKKQLVRCDLWPSEIQGTVSVTVYYRADNRTQWQLWDTFEVCAEMDNADNQWLDLAAQERGRVKTLTAPDVVDTIDQQRTDIGYGFQVRIAWTGSMLIDRIELWAKGDVPETSYSEVQDLTVSCVQNVVTNNTISYSVPVGGLGGAYTDQNGNVYADQNGVAYTESVTFAN